MDTLEESKEGDQNDDMLFEESSSVPNLPPLTQEKKAKPPQAQAELGAPMSAKGPAASLVSIMRPTSTTSKGREPLGSSRPAKKKMLKWFTSDDLSRRSASVPRLPPIKSEIAEVSSKRSTTKNEKVPNSPDKKSGSSLDTANR